MSAYLLTISSPDGNLLNEKVKRLSLRGAEGDLSILAGHTPFVTTVKPCNCKIELANGDEKYGHIDGGLLTVSEDGVILLSSTFHWN